jgi:hypothetical protein
MGEDFRLFTLTVTDEDGSNPQTYVGTVEPASTPTPEPPEPEPPEPSDDEFVAEPGFVVSGSFAAGGEITITGPAGSFKDKPGGVLPLWFFPYDSDKDPDPQLSRTGEFDDLHNGSLVEGALRFDLQPGYETAGPHISRFGDHEYVYCFLRRKYNFAIGSINTAFNLKPIRMWNNAGGNNCYLGYQGSESGNPRVFAEYTGEGGAHYGGVEPAKDAWHAFELEYKRGNQGKVDGHFHVLVNGRYFNPKSELHRMRNSERPNGYDQLYFDQKSNQTSVSPAYVYYDFILIDDSWCRVMSSDEPSYNQGCEGSFARMVMVPTEWTDMAITATLIKELPAGHTLYVVRKDGTAVKTGHRAAAAKSGGR